MVTAISLGRFAAAGSHGQYGSVGITAATLGL